MNNILQQLSSGELEVTGRLVDASNATLYATCSGSDFSFACIYKPVAGERPLWDFQDGNLAHREYAAFLISELSGWEIVPPTVLRDGPFGIGMVQQWIEVDPEIDLAEYFRQELPELRKMALFDAVINNTDRKIGHLLPSATGKLFGCDHGVTFHEEDKLRTVLWQWADQPLTANEIALLEKTRAQISENLDQLLALITSVEIQALTARIDRLISQLKFPSPSDQWPSVPWPPF